MIKNIISNADVMLHETKYRDNVISPQEVSCPNATTPPIETTPPQPNSPSNRVPYICTIIGINLPTPQQAHRSWSLNLSSFGADVTFTLSPSFDTSPHVNQIGDGNIVINDKIHSCKFSQIMIIFTAQVWGCNNPKLTYD